MRHYERAGWVYNAAPGFGGHRVPEAYEARHTPEAEAQSEMAFRLLMTAWTWPVALIAWPVIWRRR